MWAELKTLFWLQTRLTLSMFRSRRWSDRLRVLQLLLRVLMFAVTMPMAVLVGIGLAVMFILLLSPRATLEVILLANTLMLFMWLLLPASYNSQTVERFEMTRLFTYPVSFRSLVWGSTLMSALTMTGAWSVCIIAGEIVGLAWHQPLALPLILLGALPTWAMLALAGRIVDDFFDLVAGDRRLRTLMLTLLTVPMMFCGFGQMFLQQATDNYSRVPFQDQLALFIDVERLNAITTLSEFWEVVQPSRLLRWLPTSWSTLGMGAAVVGEWGTALGFLLASWGFVAVLLWAHAGITRRLMQGAALGVGAERVRVRRNHRGREVKGFGPPPLRALLRKDWLYVRRSPAVRQMVFAALMSALAVLIPFTMMPASDKLRDVVPLAVGGFVVMMVSMAFNMGLTSNYFGSIDREGFGTLAFSGVDRRWVILSANLIMLFLSTGLLALALIVLMLFTKSWVVLPLGVYLGICMQIGGAPAYTLAALIGPYRAQLKMGSNRNGNLWGMLAWAISTPPVLALIVLPYIYWRPGLILTLPLGLIYSVGLYALTLKPLAALMQRREHAILEAVTAQE